jgi:hypothetical protein
MADESAVGVMMLSMAKYHAARRGRPFAAAQGDTLGKYHAARHGRPFAAAQGDTLGKHLAARRGRPFAAAQGDTLGNLHQGSLGEWRDPSLRSG